MGILHELDFTFHHLCKLLNLPMTIFPIFCDFEWKNSTFWHNFTWNRHNWARTWFHNLEQKENMIPGTWIHWQPRPSLIKHKAYLPILCLHDVSCFQTAFWLVKSLAQCLLAGLELPNVNKIWQILSKCWAAQVWWSKFNSWHHVSVKSGDRLYVCSVISYLK